MDVRFDGLRTIKGFADTGIALVREDPDPEQIRKLAEPDGLERIDLQEMPPLGREPIYLARELWNALFHHFSTLPAHQLPGSMATG